MLQALSDTATHSNPVINSTIIDVLINNHWPRRHHYIVADIVDIETVVDAFSISIITVDLFIVIVVVVITLILIATIRVLSSSSSPTTSTTALQRLVMYW